ncbi:MAG: bifunctional DNA-formamidopyrimidine glycosylase/DNA-(apurinic or apyrimidinic site) lyase [Acidobacteriota bacterium]
MPELPEVETIRRSLLPRVLGRRVERVEARAVRLREGIRPSDWRAMAGCAVEAIERRGKYLIFLCGARAEVFHLGMSGRLTVAPPTLSRPSHTHLVQHLSDGFELRFTDPRRFGAALAMPAARLGGHAALRGLGPDAWTGAFEASLRGRARGSRVPIRNLLLDQSVLAGLGNIYANEALARAGIRPERAASAVPRGRLALLEATIRQVLDDALRAGGTTLDDEGFEDAAGARGYFAVELLVYGRQGQPCRSCGAAVRKVVLANRSAFFCPRCQR